MITTDLRPNDTQEEMLVSDFVSVGCGCSKWKGKQRSKQFSDNYFKSVRGSCAELSRSELDLVVLGQLLACTNQSLGVVTEQRSRTSAIIHNLVSPK